MSGMGKKRYSWVAVVLSLLLPGLGQVYCGKMVRGLLFACLSVLVIPVTAAMLANGVPVESFTLALAGLGGVLGLTVVAAIDAWLLARHIGHDYVLNESNRLAVYVLLFAMGKGSTLGALLYTRDQLLEAFMVPSRSMAPTIQSGDRVLGNKTAYRTCDPRRGDVVIFRDPENWRQNFVKRIVGMAGDTVEIRGGQVILNGRELERRALPGSQDKMYREVNGTAAYTILTGEIANVGPVTVPAHHFFVLGDNRDESRDSRSFGPVPLASLVARADYLYWPARDWSRFGRLDR